MKVYTVISKYCGYDEKPNKYIGTFDSLETLINNVGMEHDYMVKEWGGMGQYLAWLVTQDDFKHIDDDGQVIYSLYGRDLEWGYSLIVYESELIGKFEHKFV